MTDPTLADLVGAPASPAERDGLTDEFWAAARRGVLVRPVCDGCGRSFFTPRVLCPHCRSPRWTYVESGGRGTVSSHTTVHRGPDPSWEVPYVLAVVDLDEGWYLLSRLLVEPPDEGVPGALIGTAVTVRFVPGHGLGDPPLPAFEPVTTLVAPSSGTSP